MSNDQPTPKSQNIVPYDYKLTNQERSRIKGHGPAALWFTGLPGSGKSTIANALEHHLAETFRAHTYLLDGDNMRAGLNTDLGFGEDDRRENIRRFGEVSRLFHDAGLIVIAALISPFQVERNQVRQRFPEGTFFEVHINCPLDVCEERDPKGLYKKARAGLIQEFTGISSPYEPPESPELILNTNQSTVTECVSDIVAALVRNKILAPK
ncbi:MAG: adenylyl-sulfate kinase [Deltaproteobacteria bacterium]|nr:adenylyl-sulfate kinase [Deltaproteobacteria bacterium]